MRLVNKDNSPVGGFFFICEDGIKIATHGNLPKLVKKVGAYLLANGMPVPISLTEVVEDQICTRQPPGRCGGAGVIKNGVMVEDVTKCVHRQNELRKQKCPTCVGNVMIKIFGCEVHKECTFYKKKDIGVKCCFFCSDILVN